MLVSALSVRVKESGRGRGPAEIRNGKAMGLGLVLQLLYAQQKPTILVLQLLMPKLTLFHPRQFVFKQLYVLHRRLEDRAFVWPHIPHNLVVAANHDNREN